MRMLYDTRTVHPLDRYDYYRAGAASETAPVEVYGRPRDHLLATMSMNRIGDLDVESASWAADGQVVARRTARLIRASDPDCYRLYVSVNGGPRAEQAGNRVHLRARDIALYDMSRPWQAIHTTTAVPTLGVLLAFPRGLMPISPNLIEPLLGTAMPRRLPGRRVIVDLLIGLSGQVEESTEPGIAEALCDGIVGMIRQRLGLPDGMTPRTRRLLHMAHIRGIIRRNLRDPDLDVDGIARAAHISPRYLHKLFQDSESTPIQLLKELRLRECRRRLEDPTRLATPIKELITAHGYRRPDQFARDFRAQYGVSASQVRQSIRHEPARCEG